LINPNRRRYAARSYAKRSTPYRFEHRAIELLERVTTINIETMETAAAMQNLDVKAVVGVRSFILNGGKWRAISDEDGHYAFAIAL
jgi:hypothetical protein